MKWWWNKKVSALPGMDVAEEQMLKYNALLGADPQQVISAITAWNSGNIGMMARIVEELELRDDKMRSCSKKLRASVARCDYTILKREGYESDARAEKHQQVLKRFWSGAKATSRFKMNECGGVSLLLKQMMEAESMGFAVHELVWKILPGGELAATFIKMPLWHFENRSGKLRFLRSTHNIEGEPMEEGEWMVSTGDAVGMAAAICATLKRCTLADWAVFCERCGMPIIVGKTAAQYKSKAWNDLKHAIQAVGRDARILVDRSTEIETIKTEAANQPYTSMVEWADRAIATLYCGGDLSTMALDGQAVGSNPQKEERSMIEQDACMRLAETLHEQVERFVIRFVCGDDEPLAGIHIEPSKKPNLDADIKIDEYLIAHGVKLSKVEALQRYGRTEIASERDEDTALEMCAKDKSLMAVKEVKNED